MPALGEHTDAVLAELGYDAAGDPRRCDERRRSDDGRGPRTYLFVPGQPARSDSRKALASGADAVVLDLEDAVAADAKDDARAAVRAWAADGRPERPGPRRGADQRPRVTGRTPRTCRWSPKPGLPAVMLPKAETAEQVAAVRAAAGPLRRAGPDRDRTRGRAGRARSPRPTGWPGWCSAPWTSRWTWTWTSSDAPDGLGYAAGRLAVASRIAGLPAPVAGVTPQLGDQARLLADLAWSRRHGFGAKLCIHPAQVEPIHTALAPDAEAVAWARRVLEADRPAHPEPPGSTAA